MFRPFKVFFRVLNIVYNHCQDDCNVGKSSVEMALHRNLRKYTVLNISRPQPVH